MKTCKFCGKDFDPEQTPNGAAEEAGQFLAKQRYQDAGEVCPTCLANRGMLEMMYGREGDG